LEEQGIRVIGDAATGEDGVALAARARPDVVVMDVYLGGTPCGNRSSKMAPRGMWRAYRFCDRLL